MFKKIKQWIVKKLDSEREGMLVLAKQAGYAQAQRDLENRESVIEQFQKEIDKRVNKKYCSEQWLVNPDDVISIQHTKDNRIVGFLGGREMTEKEKKQLQEEARTLEQFRLWAVFQETLRQEAINKAVITSTEFNHTLGGKMMVHNLGIQKSILENVLKLS